MGQVLGAQHSQEPRAGAGLERSLPDTGGGRRSGKGFPAERACRVQGKPEAVFWTEKSTVKTQKENKAESTLGEVRTAWGGQRSDQEVRGTRGAGHRGGEREDHLLLLLGKSSSFHKEPA